MPEAEAPDPQAALMEIVREFGRAIGSQPERVRGLLSDALGAAARDFRASIDALVLAAEVGIPAELTARGRSASPNRDDDLLNELSRLGLSAATATFAIAAWATALDASTSVPRPMADIHVDTAQQTRTAQIARTAQERTDRRSEEQKALEPQERKSAPVHQRWGRRPVLMAVLAVVIAVAGVSAWTLTRPSPALDEITAILSPPVNQPITSSAVHFYGSGSYLHNSSANASHRVGSYVWDFGDGGSSTDPDPEHTYAKPGRYVVTLTVAAGSGTPSDTATKTVLVSDPPGGRDKPKPPAVTLSATNGALSWVPLADTGGGNCEMDTSAKDAKWCAANLVVDKYKRGTAASYAITEVSTRDKRGTVSVDGHTINYEPHANGPFEDLVWFRLVSGDVKSDFAYITVTVGCNQNFRCSG